MNHPSFWDTTWDKKALPSREDNKEDLGLELCLNIPDGPQDTLGSQAKPGIQRAPAVLPVGNTGSF